MDLPDDLIALQQAADAAGAALRALPADAAAEQRRAWFTAAAAAQAAVTEWAAAEGHNRFEVEKTLRKVVRHPELVER
ncbi:hypothetical protein [Streptomyces sp. CA-253872]|uniref:hypothetical protein n=1 Tax=Streptomyces sp. CA-253872 TaxID=3240067 RepID=UPI003D8D1C77